MSSGSCRNGRGYERSSLQGEICAWLDTICCTGWCGSNLRSTPSLSIYSNQPISCCGGWQASASWSRRNQSRPCEAGERHRTIVEQSGLPEAFTNGGQHHGRRAGRTAGRHSVGGWKRPWLRVLSHHVVHRNTFIHCWCWSVQTRSSKWSVIGSRFALLGFRSVCYKLRGTQYASRSDT